MESQLILAVRKYLQCFLRLQITMKISCIRSCLSTGWSCSETFRSWRELWKHIRQNFRHVRSSECIITLMIVSTHSPANSLPLTAHHDFPSLSPWVLAWVSSGEDTFTWLPTSLPAWPRVRLGFTCLFSGRKGKILSKWHRRGIATHIKQRVIADSMHYVKGEPAQNEIQTLVQFTS